MTLLGQQELKALCSLLLEMDNSLVIGHRECKETLVQVGCFLGILQSLVSSFGIVYEFYSIII